MGAAAGNGGYPAAVMGPIAGNRGVSRRADALTQRPQPRSESGAGETVTE